MLPALSQVCSLNSPFDRDIDEYAAAKCAAIELWLGKLKTYLKGHSVDDVRRLLETHEIAAPVASFQGGLLASQGEARKVHWEHFERRLDLCQSIGVQTIVVAGDIPPPLDEQVVDRVRMSLGLAADRAAEHDMRVAFEFQSNAALANNLQTAAASWRSVLGRRWGCVSTRSIGTSGRARPRISPICLAKIFFTFSSATWPAWCVSWPSTVTACCPAMATCRSTRSSSRCDKLATRALCQSS